MLKSYLVAGLAAAALFPAVANAQQTCAQQRDNRVAGTVIGAGVGALLGSAVSGHGARTEGAVIGGVGGAIVGNQLAKPKTDCVDAYGYYDSDGRWHANAVQSRNAVGYYAADGTWVEGAPNGYYDSNGRWIAGSGDVATSGYYDSDGRWVPAAANGYYDVNGRWVAGSTSGHWENGRWVAGYTTGYYDSDGRWRTGTAPGRYVNSRWVADPAPGHYDSNGRWVRESSAGYYDSNGRWISTAPSAGGYARDTSYEGRDMWAGAPMDVRQREAWLDRRIRQGAADGSLDRREARNALRTLGQIRREEMSMRRGNGTLRPREQAYIQAKLDNLSRNLRWMRENDRRAY